MQLTYIAPYVPYCGIGHAGGIYFHNFLTLVAREHEVRLIAPDVEVNRQALLQADPSLKIHLVRQLPGSRTLLVRALAYPFDVLQGLTIGALYLASIRADRRAKALVSTSDVVELHWSGCLTLAPWVRRVSPRAVLTAVEYDVLYQCFCRAAANSTSARTRIESVLGRHRVGRLEPKMLNLCDALFTFAPKDRAILEDLGVVAPVHLVEPYIGLPADPLGPSLEHRLLFVGALDRTENDEAARWFLDTVWPRAVEMVPDLHVTFAGNRPSPKLRARSSASVEVTGYVEDLDPLYRRARAVIVPMSTGAGIKFKALQAMAYGLPVLATSVGAEGILEEAGAACFATVSDDPDVWAEVVDALMNGRNQAQKVGERALAWVKSTHDFAASTKRVVELYSALAKR